MFHSDTNRKRSASTCFWNSKDGATAVLFAFAIVPVVACVGLAIDYGSAVKQQVQLKAVADAAVLAGMTAQSNSQDPTSTVNSFVAAQLSGSGLSPAVTLSQDVDLGQLSVTLAADRPNTFLNVLGFSTIHIEATSIAAAGTGSGPIEVAISFDTTGSMAGSKMTAAQDAATQLIDRLFMVPGSSVINPNVKVGLVPFAAYVNVGMQYRGAPWLTNAVDYSTSTYACWNTYPNTVYSNPVPMTGTCTNDGVPYSCSWTDYTVDYGAPVQVCGNQTSNYVWNGCVGTQDAANDALDGASSTNRVPALLNYTCPAPLIRLTNDTAGLKSAVAAMTAGGETYIAPGLLWGWRLLTPNAASPFADGAAYGAAKKVMILLTDGANTHSANYAAGDHEGSDVAAANAKVLETCQNIKATGIQVFTIAFAVTDPVIQSVLSQCSSGPPYYYNANTVADLQGAFQTIGSRLAGIRIIQ